jgi:hypothetical protein
MPYSTTGENNMLGNIGATHGSIHTAVPGNTGASEVSGGSPAYARKSLTLAAASGGSRSISNNPVFDIPAGTTIFFFGMWDALTVGNFLGWAPVNGGSIKGAATVDASTDTFTDFAHGLTTDDRLTVATVAGAALPTGLSVSTIYFVLASGLTTDAFKISTASGGSAVNVTVSGEVVWQKVIPQTYSVQGTYTLNSGAFDLLG